MSKNIVFFDLDYTFVNTNTTIGFIKYCLKNKKREYFFRFLLMNILFLISPLISPFKKIGAKDLLFLLRGMKKEELYLFGKEYAKEIFNNNLNKKVYSILEEHKIKGKKLILITSTIEEVAQNFSELMGFDDYFSSKLNYKDNLFNGKLRENIEGKKDLIIKQIKNKYPDSSIVFYTDNSEDLSSKKYVNEFIGVANNSNQVSFWRDKKIKYIDLSSKKIDKKTLFIPGFYYFKYRITLKQFVLYHFLFFLIILFTIGKNLPFSFISIALAWIAYISLYEIGYFMNDLYSTRLEKNPTFRIKTPSKKEKLFFIFFHFFFFIIISLSLLFFLRGLIQLNIFIFLVLSLFILLVFILHNIVNPKKRLFTYFFLKISHIIIPFSIIINIDFLIFLFVSLIIFYLPKYLLEYFLRHNYGKKISLNPRKKIFFVQLIFIFIIISVFISYGFCNFILLSGSYYLLLEILNIFFNSRQNNPPKPL